MNDELHHIIMAMSGKQKDISRYEESFLLKSLEKRLVATSVTTIADYREYLSEHDGEAAEFFRSLNITYSGFFRNPLTFALLEQQVLPRLIEEKPGSGTAEIRVWSAGCAAGQESYSVAILLDELLSARQTSLSFRIFATDISENSLASARRGVYDAAAVQNVRLKYIDSCFESHNVRYSVAGRLKKRIEFSFYDLLDKDSTSPPGSIFGDFDLIFCSNLLFYYQPDSQRFILNKIHHALADEGYLACGETERAIIEKTGLFAEVCRPSAIYRKRTIREAL
jgi:chemotaxis protein methyltransferase CheR